DCVPEVVGLELRNVVANYPFEKSRRFPGSRVHPISGTAANSYSITASPRSDVDFSQKLMDPMSRKAISSVPKLANRAPFAFVVNPFLVRTADYAVGHRDR